MAGSGGGISSILDKFSTFTGRAASWLTLARVVGTFIIVVLRYVFDTGLIWMQESVTWMHAVVFMLGAAYTLQAEEHVRVDIFYREMSKQRKAWINLLGVVFFLWPVCVFFIAESADYVAASWRSGEVSRDAGGLPYPFVPLLKSVLLLMPFTLILQGLSMAVRSINQIRRG